MSVTPAAISQQVRTLEADLGVKLFNRDAQGVSLTEAGRDLQSDLTVAFLRIREGVERARPTAPSATRLNSSGPIINKWFIPRLHRFITNSPDVNVSVETSTRIENLDHEGPDVVIRFSRSLGAGLYAQKLCDEYFVPMASPDLLARLNISEPGDLTRAPLLHDRSSEVFSDVFNWSKWFTHYKLSRPDSQPEMRFDRFAADQAIDAAVNGVGVVLGRYFLAFDDIKAGRLVTLFDQVFPANASYFVACRQGMESLPHIKPLMDWISAESSRDRAGMTLAP